MSWIKTSDQLPPKDRRFMALDARYNYDPHTIIEFIEKERGACDDEECKECPGHYVAKKYCEMDICRCLEQYTLDEFLYYFPYWQLLEEPPKEIESFHFCGFCRISVHAKFVSYSKGSDPRIYKNRYICDYCRNHERNSNYTFYDQ